jgi:hypothetical protein
MTHKPLPGTASQLAFFEGMTVLALLWYTKRTRNDEHE